MINYTQCLDAKEPWLVLDSEPNAEKNYLEIDEILEISSLSFANSKRDVQRCPDRVIVSQHEVVHRSPIVMQLREAKRHVCAEGQTHLEIEHRSQSAVGKNRHFHVNFQFYPKSLRKIPN